MKPSPKKKPTRKPPAPKVITPEIIPPETSEKTRKPFRKPVGALSKPSKDAVELATKYDMPPKEAYQVITGKTPHPETLKNIEKAVERWSLKHPVALRSASKTVAKFAKGQEVNGIKPKDSTVLAAAQRIVDATEPIIKQTMNLNITAEIDPVDLSMFRKR